MAAAQIFAAATEAVPDIPEAIGRGDFAPLMTWLAENVHGLGSLHTKDELIEHATGKPLDPKIFEASLRARYLGES